MQIIYISLKMNDQFCLKKDILQHFFVYFRFDEFLQKKEFKQNTIYFFYFRSY